jgi:8-oxo-dGTP pyrophosphatase MutT (NUDIX family)
MIEALKRECIEEIGVDVEVHDLKLIREYIGRNHEFSDEDKDIHQIEFMFLCSIKEGEIPKPGNNPDSFQESIEWIPLKEIEKYRLYPQSARNILKNLGENKTIYLGDIN